MRLGHGNRVHELSFTSGGIERNKSPCAAAALLMAKGPILVLDETIVGPAVELMSSLGCALMLDALGHLGCPLAKPLWAELQQHQKRLFKPQRLMLKKQAHATGPLSPPRLSKQAKWQLERLQSASALVMPDAPKALLLSYLKARSWQDFKAVAKQAVDQINEVRPAMEDLWMSQMLTQLQAERFLYAMKVPGFQKRDPYLLWRPQRTAAG